MVFPKIRKPKTIVCDGVLYVYNKELDIYEEQHDVLDDIVEMIENKEKVEGEID